MQDGTIQYLPIKGCQKSTNSSGLSDYDIEGCNGQSNTQKKMKCQQTSVNPDLLSDCVRTNTFDTPSLRFFCPRRFIRKRQNSIEFYFRSFYNILRSARKIETV
ncbi:hypothetical protein NPIL_249431 [Nephila pilipes]|uniref:Uncharacterized protein n=1 Tax=Nephila pilipes TaxID=299642 RepID=A0A8X6T2X9_NEPPI|nr:hypothetical protein NPIL_484221 [Nephila pilipes]GFT09627.1 hypothetical protein NPIL_255101 [Nephila pilipes]GFT18968.1 hypothetical protein NPIL_658011 [Nephila pilipes]GFU01487.1 hypothetical protein NPIL_249431 [Nephila pilipes]